AGDALAEVAGVPGSGAGADEAGVVGGAGDAVVAGRVRQALADAVGAAGSAVALVVAAVGAAADAVVAEAARAGDAERAGSPGRAGGRFFESRRRQRPLGRSGRGHRRGLRAAAHQGIGGARTPTALVAGEGAAGIGYSGRGFSDRVEQIRPGAGD